MTLAARAATRAESAHANSRDDELVKLINNPETWVLLPEAEYETELAIEWMERFFPEKLERRAMPVIKLSRLDKESIVVALLRGRGGFVPSSEELAAGGKPFFRSETTKARKPPTPPFETKAGTDGRLFDVRRDPELLLKELFFSAPVHCEKHWSPEGGWRYGGQLALPGFLEEFGTKIAPYYAVGFKDGNARKSGERPDELYLKGC